MRMGPVINFGLHDASFTICFDASQWFYILDSYPLFRSLAGIIVLLRLPVYYTAEWARNTLKGIDSKASRLNFSYLRDSFKSICSY